MRLTKDDYDFCKGCKNTGFEGGIPICIEFVHDYPKVTQIKHDCTAKKMYDKLRKYEQEYELE